MADPANPYRLLEEKLREVLDTPAYNTKVELGRRGRSGHGNATNLLVIIPSRETFGVGVSAEGAPRPAKTRTRTPVLEFRAPDLDTIDLLVDVVVDVLDENFRGSYAVLGGTWYDEDSAATRGERFSLPVQISSPVPTRAELETDEAEVLSTSSQYDVIHHDEPTPPEVATRTWRP